MTNKLELYKQELVEAQGHLRHTKYILLSAFLLCPLGLFFRPLVSLIIFFTLAILWGVAAYISFMHCLAAQRKLDDIMKE